MVVVVVMGMEADLIELGWVDGRMMTVEGEKGHITDFADLRTDTESSGQFAEAVGRSHQGWREGRAGTMGVGGGSSRGGEARRRSARHTGDRRSGGMIRVGMMRRTTGGTAETTATATDGAAGAASVELARGQEWMGMMMRRELGQVGMSTGGRGEAEICNAEQSGRWAERSVAVDGRDGGRRG